MKKLTILATTAAIAVNAVSPAFAAPLPSWQEVITKYQTATANGGFHGATLGIHSNAVFKPLAGADGFLFGNVLADDIPLPRVTDVRKVLEAAKDANKKPIIVAGRNYILPANEMICEIARQVKMECGDFAELFYKYMQKDDDGKYVGDNSAAEALETIQTDLIEKLEAMDLEVYAKNPVVEALEKQIASIKENNPTGQDELIAELQKTIDIMDKFYGTEVDLTAINEVLQNVDAHYQTMKQNYIDEAEAHAQTIQNHIDLLASYRASMKSAGVPVNKDVQTMINSLVKMRDIALDKAAYWKESSETWEANSEMWEAQSNSWENAANTFEASAKKWEAAYNAQLDAWQAEKAAKEAALAQAASLSSQLSAANQAKANLQNQLTNANAAKDNLQNQLTDANDKYNNYHAEVENFSEVVGGDLAEAKAEIKELKGKIANLNTEIDNLKKQLQAAVNSDPVTIAQHAKFVGYTDDSITFKVDASNGASMSFKVTTTDFTSNGFHLEFNNGGQGNFEFDITAKAYKDFIASLSNNVPDAAALQAKYDEGHAKAVSQFVADMKEQAGLWAPDAEANYTMQGDITYFAADVWDAGKTQGKKQGAAAEAVKWQDSITNSVHAKLQDFNASVSSKITTVAKLDAELAKLVDAAQADLKADAEAYQALVAQNALNPGIAFVQNAVTEATEELQELQADIDSIMKESNKAAYNYGFADGYYWGHKDGKADNTDNQNKNSETNPYN